METNVNGQAVQSGDLLAAVLSACVKVKAESDAIKDHMGAAVQSDVCHVVIKIIEEARRQVTANMDSATSRKAPSPNVTISARTA